MLDCPYNHGVGCDKSHECAADCGFVPEENERRKRAINKGMGLTRDKKGLSHLEIKRRK